MHLTVVIQLRYNGTMRNVRGNVHYYDTRVCGYCRDLVLVITVIIQLAVFVAIPALSGRVRRRKNRTAMSIYRTVPLSYLHLQ